MNLVFQAIWLVHYLELIENGVKNARSKQNKMAYVNSMKSTILQLNWLGE